MYIRVRQVLALLCALLLVLAAGSAQALTRLAGDGVKPGSPGVAIAALQNNLRELGLYAQKADGSYGSRTAAAVKLLQAHLNVPVNGVCDAQTVAAFNARYIDARSMNASARAVALKGKKIGIDAGHQKDADGAYEPIAPGSDRSREKMSAGSVGVKTGIREYETALVIAKKLQARLEAVGATVVMARTENDVHLSNIERAEAMNTAAVDCWVRIHFDSSADPATGGIHVLAPSEEAVPDIAADSQDLAKLLLAACSQETGAKALGVLVRDDQTGFNWSERPVVAVELGYLSNPTEDVRLNRAYYQDECAQGLFEGLSAYFA